MSSSSSPPQLFDRKKLLLISGFNPDPNGALFSLPSARAFAVLKDPVLFVIPVAPGKEEELASMKKQVRATCLALHPARSVICLFTPDAPSVASKAAAGASAPLPAENAPEDGPGSLQVFDLTTKARAAKVALDLTPTFVHWANSRSFGFVAAAGTYCVVELQPNFAPPTAAAGDLPGIVRTASPLFDLFEEVMDPEFCRIYRIDCDLPFPEAATGPVALPTWYLVVTRCSAPEDEFDPHSCNELVHQLHSIERDASQLVTAQHARLHRRPDGLFLYLVVLMESGLTLTLLSIHESENTPPPETPMRQFTLDLPPTSTVIEIIPHEIPGVLLIFTRQSEVLAINTAKNGFQISSKPFVSDTKQLLVAKSLHNPDHLIVLEQSGAIHRLTLRRETLEPAPVLAESAPATVDARMPTKRQLPDPPKTAEYETPKAALKAAVVSPTIEKLKLPPIESSVSTKDFTEKHIKKNEDLPEITSLEIPESKRSIETPTSSFPRTPDAVLVELLKSGDYTTAALHCADKLLDVIIVRLALEASHVTDVDVRLATLFEALLPLRMLSETESVVFAKSCAAASSSHGASLVVAVATSRLTPSLALGEVLLQGHSNSNNWASSAADVFLAIGLPERSVSTLVILDRCAELVAFLKKSLHPAPTDPTVLSRLLHAPFPAPAELAVLMYSAKCMLAIQAESAASGVKNSQPLLSGKKKAAHARTLLDILLRGPDVSNVIFYLDKILEDTDSFGALQTIYMQMLNRCDKERFSSELNKFTFYDRSLFGLPALENSKAANVDDAKNALEAHKAAESRSLKPEILTSSPGKTTENINSSVEKVEPWKQLVREAFIQSDHDHWKDLLISCKNSGTFESLMGDHVDEYVQKFELEKKNELWDDVENPEVALGELLETLVILGDLEKVHSYSLELLRRAQDDEILKKSFNRLLDIATLSLMVISKSQNDIDFFVTQFDFSEESTIKICFHLLNFGHFELCTKLMAKFGTKYSDAIAMILVNDIGDIPRAFIYAESVDTPEVWAIVGGAAAEITRENKILESLLLKKSQVRNSVFEAVFLNK